MTTTLTTPTFLDNLKVLARPRHRMTTPFSSAARVAAAFGQLHRQLLRPMVASIASGVLLSTVTPGVLLNPQPIRAQEGRSCEWIAQGPQLLKQGFRWSEGPVWVAADQHWVFSDVMGDRQYTITPTGTLNNFRTPSGYANGNNLAVQGFLVSAQHDRQLVAVTRQGKTLRVLASSYQGKKLNSPNGVAIAPDGAIWFTDPPMGISGYGPVKAPQELPYQGIFRLSNGTLSLMDASMGLPNGIAFSKDGQRLYVSDTKTNAVTVFNVDPQTGSLSGKRTFATLVPVPGGGKEGVADGLKVDRRGNVWATGPGGITVYNPAGVIQCQLPFPAHVADLAFGGPKGDLILVASADKLYLLRGRSPF